MTPDDESRTEVLVAGAGLPGLALAAALARAKVDVTIVDRQMPHAPAPAGADDIDARVYAVSPGSARFLGALGAWDTLPADRVAPIETMRIEGDRGAVLAFDAYDLGEPALAWIVEERELRGALLAAAHDAGARLVAPVSFAALDWRVDGATLALDDGRRIDTKLVVGADGARSWVRDAAGLAAVPRPYGQVAVVANFACERPHGGCAHQWFRDDGGVLAWLPLPGARMSMVWSASEALAAELMALAPEDLAERVAAAGGRALGTLRGIGRPAAFPLAFLKLPAVIAHRLALVGDAAHGIHPLAGQGVNLGFGDAETLAAVIAGRGAIADPGAPILLERYARRRAEPVAAMQAVTDGLARLFGAGGAWPALRNLGLAAVSKIPYARVALARPALR